MSRSNDLIDTTFSNDLFKYNICSYVPQYELEGFS